MVGRVAFHGRVAFPEALQERLGSEPSCLPSAAWLPETHALTV